MPVTGETSDAAEIPLLDDVVDGVIDYKGRPVARSKFGGWRSASFIIGVEVAERFAYYGISSNLISYLTGPLGQSTATAAENVNAWSGTASLLPLLGAFVADSFLGRFRTIIFSSLLYILGLGLLTLSALLPSFSSSDCLNATNVSPCSPPQLQVVFFFFSLYLVAVAQGGHKPCVQAFGADQFDSQDPQERKAKSSFFNWWYFSLCAGTLTTLWILNYIQDNLSWGLGFGIPCIMMVFALAIFLLGSITYRFGIRSEEKSPFIRIGRVFVQAARNWRTTSSAIAMEEEAKGILPHPGSDQFKFLNKALLAPDGSKEEGKVCSINEVEDAKAVLRLVPIWTTCLAYAIVFAQSSTFFTKQGATMDRSIGPSFDIPAATLQSFISLSIIVFIPIYDRLFVPIARAITQEPLGITMLQRVGTGILFSTISMVIAAMVEGKRLHWDLNKYSKRKSTDVLLLLRKVAAYALNLTSFFYCQVAPTSETKGLPTLSCLENSDNGDPPGPNLSDTKKDANVETRDNNNGINEGGHHFVKPPMFQKGVLRTNCIDCLDRTNVAQYAYGLVALGHQLHALGFIEDPNIDMDSPLANDLMRVYETMGDTLALQYGGSAAHNKIFSQRRGQWIAATQSQEFFRTLQRYYNNAYMDAEKQDAINVFLGHFQPQQGKPALWELDSDQHYNIRKHGSDLADENARLSFKRSRSEGNILCESNLPIDATDVGLNEYGNQSAPGNAKAGNKGLSESTPEISICDNELSYSGYTPSMSSRQLFPDMQLDRSLLSDCTCFDKRQGSCDCSNFLDVEWVSSSGNSCEEDAYERSALILSSPVASGSLDSVVTGSNIESTASASESGSGMKGSDLAEFSDSFVHWVNHGEMFCR